jgi:hypothetical protein
VVFEEGEREPLETETDAGGMRNIAGLRVDPPGYPEVILVVVEAQARGRLLDAFDAGILWPCRSRPHAVQSETAEAKLASQVTTAGQKHERLTRSY